MDRERVTQAQAQLALHYGNDLGFVTLQRLVDGEMRSKTVRLAAVADELDDLPNEGTYFSLSSFGRFNRQAKSLWWLHSLYCDLDCGKLGLDPDETLATLERSVFGVTLPVPTYALLSGRGVWLFYCILPRKNDKRGTNVQRWRETQAHLIDVLRPYGADPTSNDVTRTCRLAGTINQKNSADVRLRVYESRGRYSLSDLHDFASERACATDPTTPKAKAPRPVVDVRSLYVEDDDLSGGNEKDDPP